ncbi:hypothetical protein QBZ16_000479 [Prototheca wickerhamii]|uniref:diacylglycerol O-acyltransferase n=1 Tax=Prototheca wickerhamii TaxID=3111 RepID=A0AAD9MM43_PROWI|nr:hypothetical protein QBZ16_000479 [Prototheca wickerhamii]
MSKAASSTWEKISNRVKNSAEKKEAPSNPLEATVEELKQENARLKELIKDRTSQDATKSGYLNKYRPYATASLWASTWEPRYVVVRHRHLSYYKNEASVQYPPRGQFDLDGTSVELEGRKRHLYWTFRILDSGGVSLLRLSTESRAEARAWMDALEKAGSRRAGGKDGRPKRDAMVGSSPVHARTTHSLLSSERISFSNQNGLVNLTMLALLAANFRLVLENMLKYGVRFNPWRVVRGILTPANNPPLELCWPLLALLALAALGIERFALAALRREQRWLDAAAKKKDDWVVFALNFVNTSAILGVPAAVIHYTHSELLPGFALCTVSVILWLKTVSYAHCNWDLRMAHRAGELRDGERDSAWVPRDCAAQLKYPENLTLRNLGYFLAAPTLCYQLSYPRSERFRLKWLLRRVLMFALTITLMMFMIEQYVNPLIHNSLKPMMSMDWLRLFERVLKLSLPNLYLWLLMFYAGFHLWLNIAAELTMFGDREFYKEWWNATTIGEYWRLWNQPVHQWMLRHCYFPCVRHGVPKVWAGIVVFFVSAVFHEWIVALPLHMVKGWAFLGIMFQVPLMLVTEKLKQQFNSDRIGNAIFWISFCILGQPLCIMLYYHDYYKAQLEG